MAFQQWQTRVFKMLEKNVMNVFEKAIRVMKSCETKEHVATAQSFVQLAYEDELRRTRKSEHLFVYFRYKNLGRIVIEKKIGLLDLRV